MKVEESSSLQQELERWITGSENSCPCKFPGLFLAPSSNGSQPSIKPGLGDPTPLFWLTQAMPTHMHIQTQTHIHRYNFKNEINTKK